MSNAAIRDAPPGTLARYHVSRGLARLVRIGEPELVAVGVLDDHQSLAPPAVLERHALRQQVGAQRVVLRRAEAEIDRALARLVRRLRMEQEAAVVAADPGRRRSARLLVTPVHPEAERVGVEGGGGAGVADEEDRAAGPTVGHGAIDPSARIGRCIRLRMSSKRWLPRSSLHGG